jgi:hypothetical protein
VPTYRVNKDAVTKARELIDAGKFDDSTEWSDAAPSADDENAEIEKNSYDGYGAWHLAVDPDASEETKSRYAFPFGDFRKVNRAHPRQAARGPERPRRDREGGGRVAGRPGREARRMTPPMTRQTRRQSPPVLPGA